MTGFVNVSGRYAAKDEHSIRNRSVVGSIPTARIS